MSRGSRVIGESGLYHVIVKGNGGQLLFEDDADRSRFLATVHSKIRVENARLLAYCLMSNHAHLLVREGDQGLPVLMKRICVSYASYFNEKHGRMGSLFGERYRSTPVESERQFLSTVRYIHRNPIKAGISDSCDYRWNSYRSMLVRSADVDTTLVYELIGDAENLARFHLAESDFGEAVLEEGKQRRRVSDEEAVRMIDGALGEHVVARVHAYPRKERDAMLSAMRQMGFSIRQLQRLTGIGYSIIANAR